MSETPYKTPAGNTVADFTNFHDGAKGGNSVTLEVTLDVASDVVEALAPRPTEDPESWPTDYVRRARNGERMVARWIWDTDGGQTSSSSGVIGTSISYQSSPKVQEIVASAMGPYAKVEVEEESSGDDGIIRIERL